MKPFVVFCLLLAVTCASLASPADVELLSLSPQARQLEFISSSKKLIQDLVANLTRAAQQAREAIANFTNGIKLQASKIMAKFQENLDQLKQRVLTTMKSVSERFVNAGADIKQCVETGRNQSDTIFQNAVEKTKSCAEDRLREAKELISDLSGVPDEIRDLVTEVYAGMRNCTQQNTSNLVAAGSCVGTVAVQAEMKGAGLLAQSGLSIARVNLFITTLVGSLEVCAGSGLIEAGVTTGRIVTEIGSCSASSIFANFTRTSLTTV